MAGEKKYEREIAEILERMDREEPKTDRVKRQARQTVQRRRESFGETADRICAGSAAVSGASAGWTWIGVTIGSGVLGLLLRGISPILAGALRRADVRGILQPAAPAGEWRTRRGTLDDVARQGGRYSPARFYGESALSLAALHQWR